MKTKQSGFRSLALLATSVVVGTGFWLLYGEAQQIAPAKSLPDAVEKARAIVRENFVGKAPGISIAVAMDGKIIWSEGFGYADVEQKKPVTAQTMFRIGSISKPVTAAGMMLLVEQGKLDLDADIHQYIPDYPDKGAKITTRQLAGHLGGVRHYKGNEFALNQPFADVRTGLKIFENDPLLSPPGTKFNYSTYGWSVISAVMESASKQEFVSYMEQSVFRPLNMSNTAADRAGVNNSQRTSFYERTDAGGFAIAPVVDNSYKWAGGGFLSTPEDLLRFGMAHLQPGFLRKGTLEAMFTPQKLAEGTATDYGIGWSILKDGDGHMIWMHTGGSMGGTSALIIHPDSRVVVAMTANCSRSPFDKKNRESIAEIFSGLFNAAKAAGSSN